MNKSFAKNEARAAALVGVMAATVECAKLALASIPNVEVVTLLIASYSYVFGPLGVLASVVFVIMEPLIWGFGGWFISYLIYWPTVAVVFALLGRLRRGRIIIPTLTAVILTLLFGVLSSLVDIGLFTGYFDSFFERFFIYYLRGIPFYLTQIITNAVVFPLTFPLITKLLFKIKESFR